MSAPLTATAIVQYDASEGGFLGAELDARPDGFNFGAVSFLPSGRPVFLVWATAPYRVQVSAGSLSLKQKDVVVMQEQDVLTYLAPGVVEHTVPLNYPMSGGYEFAVDFAPPGVTTEPARLHADRYRAVSIRIPESSSGQWLMGRLRYETIADAYQVAAPAEWSTNLPSNARIALLVDQVKP